MKHIQESVVNYVNTAQFTVNYVTIALAAIAGMVLETLAHLIEGNGLMMGIPLSIVSVAALTTGIVTNKWWVLWIIYPGQLAIGLMQFSTLPTALLSLTSVVGGVSAALMMDFVLSSRQQDKQGDNDLTVQLAKIEADKEVKLAKHSRSDIPVPPNTKRDYSEAQNMRNNGMSLAEIAKITGYSKSSISTNTVRAEHSTEHLNGHKSGQMSA